MQEWTIGKRAETSKTIAESDVYLFAGITGDFNPAHMDKVKAENSIFGERIVHGMLSAGLISAVIGTKYPGEGTIYMEQDVKFLKPVRFGDTITAVVELMEVMNSEKGILKLNTFVKNQNDETVISGYAVVKAPKEER